MFLWHKLPKNPVRNLKISQIRSFQGMKIHTISGGDYGILLYPAKGPVTDDEV